MVLSVILRLCPFFFLAPPPPQPQQKSREIGKESQAASQQATVSLLADLQPPQANGVTITFVVTGQADVAPSICLVMYQTNIWCHIGVKSHYNQMVLASFSSRNQ